MAIDGRASGPVESEVALTAMAEKEIDVNIDEYKPEQVNDIHERNWFQKAFNFGGPGWIHDVVDVEIFLDTSTVVREPDDFFLTPYSVCNEVSVFKTNDTITGTMKVRCPPAKKVWVEKLTVQLQQFVMILEDWDTTELMEVDVVVPGTEQGAYVSGIAEFPFKIELGDVEADGKGWQESYTGSLYSMRHVLNVTVHRPWYGYNIEKRYPIYLERVDPAPQPVLADGTRFDEPTIKLNRDLAEGRAKHVLPLTDVRAAKVEFDYLKTNFNLSETLKGDLVFEGVDKVATGGGVVSVKVELLKVEFGNNDMDERVMYREMLYPPGAAEAVPCVPKERDPAAEAAREEISSLGRLTGHGPVAADAENAFDGVPDGTCLSFVNVPIHRADPLRAVVGPSHDMPAGEPFHGDRTFAIAVDFGELYPGLCRQNITPTYRVLFLETALREHGAAASQQLADQFDAADRKRDAAREAVRKEEEAAGIVLTARQQSAREAVHREEDDEEEHQRVAVKYFVRVHTRDAAGHDSWNTNEIKIHRDAMIVATRVNADEL